LWSFLTFAKKLKTVNLSACGLTAQVLPLICENGGGGIFGVEWLDLSSNPLLKDTHLETLLGGIGKKSLLGLRIKACTQITLEGLVNALGFKSKKGGPALRSLDFSDVLKEPETVKFFEALGECYSTDPKNIRLTKIVASLYDMPLTKFPESVRKHCTVLAAWDATDFWPVKWYT